MAQCAFSETYKTSRWPDSTLKVNYLETEYHEHTKQSKVKSSLRIMRSEDEKLLRFIDLIDLVIEKL